MSDWKGQDVLARALAEPPLESIGAVGLVAGAPWPGAERPAAELDRLRDELSLGDRLRVLGFRPDLDALLGAVDAVAVPSTRPDPVPERGARGGRRRACRWSRPHTVACRRCCATARPACS